MCSRDEVQKRHKNLKRWVLLIPIGSMVLLYMVTFTINIPQMLAYIPAPWILWDMGHLIWVNYRERLTIGGGVVKGLMLQGVASLCMSWCGYEMVMLHVKQNISKHK